MMVAMGDSFSSGEGASEGNLDYYPESNWRSRITGKRDACHRSRHAWSRQAKIPGESLPTSDLDDAWSARMDYHLIACSGARTYNVLYKNKVQDNGGEVAQIEQGYLDQHTTLVTISIGGNDARFADVIQSCLISFASGSARTRCSTILTATSRGGMRSSWDRNWRRLSPASSTRSSARTSSKR
jgi:hypothetical protein